MLDDITDFIEDNAVLLVLLGLGAAAVVYGRQHPESYRQAYAWAGRQARYARRQAEGAYESVRHQVADTYEDARHQTNRAAAEGRYRWDEASDQYGRSYDQDYGSTGGGYTGGGYRTGGYSGDGFTGGNRQGRMGRTAGQARDMASRVGQQATYANRSLWEMVDEYPAAAGVMALALGAAIGATLPSTRVEDEWFGEYRDQLVDEVWTEGQDVVNRAGDVVRDAAEAGAEAARDQAMRSADEKGLNVEGARV